MPLIAEEIAFQMPVVKFALSLSIDSIPPTRRERATRATERSRASSISWAATRPLFFLRKALMINVGVCG